MSVDASIVPEVSAEVVARIVEVSNWLIPTIMLLVGIVVVINFFKCPKEKRFRYMKQLDFILLFTGVFLILISIQLNFSNKVTYQAIFSLLGISFKDVITSLAIFLGLVWTYKRINLTEENINLTEKNNLSIQIKNSFELLANKEAEIRIGGIYVLGDIAFNNAEPREWLLRQLCVHVQEKSPNLGEDKNEKITTEIKETLNAITRIKKAYPLMDIDLSRSNLMKANLYGADLRNANLRGVDLSDVDLRYADLREAKLMAANLWDVDLKGVDLRGAMMCDRDYEDFDYWYADLGRSEDLATRLKDTKFLYREKYDLEEAYPEIKDAAVLWCDTIEDPKKSPIEKFKDRFLWRRKKEKTSL